MDKRLLCWAVGVVAALAGVADAALVVNVGNHPIRPEPGQLIFLSVTGGDLIESVDLNVQIGDGGVFNQGFDTVPVIESLTLLAPGTIFYPNHWSGEDPEFVELLPMMGFASTGIEFDDEGLGVPVVASGWLAVLAVDASGTFAGESFPLLLSGVASGIWGPNGVDTTFASTAGPIDVEIINGWIRIVAQPDALAWDGSGQLDGFKWGSAHWEDGTGLVAPSGGEALLVDAGWVGVTEDHSGVPVERLIIGGAGAINGATVAISEDGALAVDADVIVHQDGTLAVDGTLGAWQVISYGMLSGSGTIDAEEVVIGGTLAPSGASGSPLGGAGAVGFDVGAAGVSSAEAGSGGTATVPEPGAFFLLAAAAILLAARRAGRRAA